MLPIHSVPGFFASSTKTRRMLVGRGSGYSVYCPDLISRRATRSVFIEYLTSPELRDAIAAGKTSAIIYAGGIEQNGAHMALIKHKVIARHVAGQIAERLGMALVYPIIPFSMNGDPSAEKAGHMRFPGTITVSSDVFLGVIRGVTLWSAPDVRMSMV